MVLFCLLVPISCPCLMFMLALINHVSLYFPPMSTLLTCRQVFITFLFYRTATTSVGTKYYFPLPPFKAWIRSRTILANLQIMCNFNLVNTVLMTKALAMNIKKQRSWAFTSSKKHFGLIYSLVNGAMYCKQCICLESSLDFSFFLGTHFFGNHPISIRCCVPVCLLNE